MLGPKSGFSECPPFAALDFLLPWSQWRGPGSNTTLTNSCMCKTLCHHEVCLHSQTPGSFAGVFPDCSVSSHFLCTPTQIYFHQQASQVSTCSDYRKIVHEDVKSAWHRKPCLRPSSWPFDSTQQRCSIVCHQVLLQLLAPWKTHVRQLVSVSARMSLSSELMGDWIKCHCRIEHLWHHTNLSLSMLTNPHNQDKLV